MTLAERQREAARFIAGARALGRKLWPQGGDEAISAALTGLWVGALKFDPQRSRAFWQTCKWWILAEISDAKCRNDLIRVPHYLQRKFRQRRKAECVEAADHARRMQGGLDLDHLDRMTRARVAGRDSQARLDVHQMLAVAEPWDRRVFVTTVLRSAREAARRYGYTQQGISALRHRVVQTIREAFPDYGTSARENAHGGGRKERRIAVDRPSEPENPASLRGTCDCRLSVVGCRWVRFPTAVIAGIRLAA